MRFLRDKLALAVCDIHDDNKTLGAAEKVPIFVRRLCMRKGFLLVSVVIVSYNAREYLRRCLASVVRHQLSGKTEVVVVDNASSDGAADLVEENFPSVTLLRSERNIGFAPACNQGIRLTSKPYVLLLNNDAELLPSTLERMVAFAEAHPDAAVLGAQQLDGDGNPLSCSLVTGSFMCHPIAPNGRDRPLGRAWVSGACMLLRREACEEIGWLDENLVFGYDDMEICWRVHRTNWNVYFVPDAKVIHHLEKSTGDGFNPYVYTQSRLGLAWVTRKYYPPIVRLFMPWWVVAGVVIEGAYAFLNDDSERAKGCAETVRECMRAFT